MFLITCKPQVVIREQTRTRELAIHIKPTEDAAGNNRSVPGTIIGI